MYTIVYATILILNPFNILHKFLIEKYEWVLCNETYDFSKNLKLETMQ